MENFPLVFRPNLKVTYIYCLPAFSIDTLNQYQFIGQFRAWFSLLELKVIETILFEVKLRTVFLCFLANSFSSKIISVDSLAEIHHSLQAQFPHQSDLYAGKVPLKD